MIRRTAGHRTHREHLQLDPRMLRTNQFAPRRPSRNSAGQMSRDARSLGPPCAALHTGAPSAPLPYTPAPLAESGPRSAAPCGAACAEPCDPTPESHRRTPLPVTSSLAVALSSSAAPVTRSGLPPAPCACVRPTSVLLPESCPPQTRTPGVSARITPPSISSPTPAPRPSSRSVKTRSSLCQRGVPKQTAKWAKASQVAKRI